jgi:hypothetical protein
LQHVGQLGQQPLSALQHDALPQQLAQHEGQPRQHLSAVQQLAAVAAAALVERGDPATDRPPATDNNRPRKILAFMR